MNRLITAIILTFTLLITSCATQTGGISINGKLDPVEMATINLAVGVAMSSRPEAIVPAYDISTILLAVLDNSAQTVTIALLEEVVKKETAKLKLDPLARQSFDDLLLLVRAEISNRLLIAGIPETTKLIVVHDIIQIVHDSAAARLKLVK